MHTSDAQIIEVFQLCLKAIARTTNQIAAQTDALYSISPYEQQGNIPDEVRQLVFDLKPYFEKARALLDASDCRIPKELRRQFTFRSHKYDNVLQAFFQALG